MNEVTHILSAIEQGDPAAAEQLLPLLYHELRRLAAQKLAQEKPGQTLQATALVHEAYLRLVASPGRKSGESPPHWNSRGHFFAAAAEAMRRILVERARRKKRQKRGGGLKRMDLDSPELTYQSSGEDILAIDDALEKLAADNPDAAQLVRLRYFAGLSVEEAAQAAGIPRSTAYEHWAYARACLRCLLQGGEDPVGS
jgi:RNA polymerase sigma factor (TIGR02999 family)